MSVRLYMFVLAAILYLHPGSRAHAESCDTNCNDQCEVAFGVPAPACLIACEAAKALLICNPPTIKNPAGPLAPLLPDEVNEAYEQAWTDAQGFVNALPKDAANTVEDAINSADQAISDTARTLVKAADDIVDAGEAVARFYERQLKAYPDMLSDAEKRLREGKVVDAIWHLGTDPARATEKHAGQLVQENEIVAAAAQSAAGFYGGPAGAAAFAAWKAYHLSDGDVDLAIKAGVLAYATSAGYANVDALPTGTAGEIAKKAATTGAVSGLSVAASGGSNEDAIRAFVQSGGAIVVQSGQAYLKAQWAQAVNPETLSVETDSYCTTIFGGTCAEAQDWYEEAKAYADAAKKLQSGKPDVVFTSDGNWAVSWVPRANPNQQVGTAPSVTLTYVGEGSPYFGKFQEIARLMGKEITKNTSLGWIYLGRRHSDGTWSEPRSVAQIGPEFEDLEGMVIVLSRDANRRAGPRAGCNLNDDKPIVGTLAAGQTVRIVTAQRLRPGCSNYIWAEVEAVR